MMEVVEDLVLMSMLAMIAIAIVRLNNLFAVVMLSGAYSLITACLFVVLDAVDVAFTEAAVGAGVSTVLMLSTLALTRRHEKEIGDPSTVPFLVVSLTGVALLVATFDMPFFGSADAPIHNHVAPEYIAGSATDIDVPNIVTAVLASYRGFDTLGEVAVIFTAGIGVLVLLGSARTYRKNRLPQSRTDKTPDQTEGEAS